MAAAGRREADVEVEPEAPRCSGCANLIANGLLQHQPIDARLRRRAIRGNARAFDEGGLTRPRRWRRAIVRARAIEYLERA